MARRSRSRRTRSRARTRTVTKYRTRSVGARRRRSSGGGGRGGWLPLSTKDSVMAFGVGAIAPTVNGFVAPYTDGFLGFAGDYKDELRTALIGVAAYKVGSGMVKDAGREMYRYALFSAGQQAGSNFLGGTGTNSSAASW